MEKLKQLAEKKYISKEDYEVFNNELSKEDIDVLYDIYTNLNIYTTDIRVDVEEWNDRVSELDSHWEELCDAFPVTKPDNCPYPDKLIQKILLREGDGEFWNITYDDVIDSLKEYVVDNQFNTQIEDSFVELD